MNVGDEHSVSVWMAETPVTEASPLTADAEAEVVVIGSGIAGLSTAYELSRLGRSFAPEGEVLNCPAVSPLAEAD
jgi:ribulose 1,5-bisphosphate synthetase/thiazole synthase